MINRNSKSYMNLRSKIPHDWGNLSQLLQIQTVEEYGNLRLPLMVDLPKPAKNNIYICRFDPKNVRPGLKLKIRDPLSNMKESKNNQSIDPSIYIP